MIKHLGITRKSAHQAMRWATLITVMTMQLCGAALADTAWHYRIPAQPLEDALMQFATDTNLRLLLTADQVRGMSAKGIDGSMTQAQALSQLLQGSGMTYRFVDAKTVTVEPPDAKLIKTTAVRETPELQSGGGDTTLPKVTVEADADSPYADSNWTNDPSNTDYNRPNASTATKTDTPIMETPLAIQVIPQQVMKDQQATRLNQAVQNISGVYVGPGTGGTVENIFVRGFQDFNPYYNGVRLSTGWTQQGLRDIAGLERVEVLKGPGSILFGRIEPGGMINMVPKSPLTTPYYALQQQFGSFDSYRTSIDATGPIADDKSLLYRVNLAYENKDSFRDFVQGERVVVAPRLQWNISDSTQANFFFDYLHNDISPDIGGPPVFRGKVVDLPRSRSLLEPNARAISEDVLFGWDFTHAFNDQWTLRHRFYTNFTQDDENLPGAPTSIQANGRFVDRANFGVRDNTGETYFTNIDLTGKFKTGLLEHTLLAGFDYNYFQNKFSWPNGDPVPAIDIFNPVYNGNLGLLSTNFLDNGDVGDDWYGLYLQDQVKLPYDFFLLTGMRYDNADGWTYFGDDRIETNDDQVTPRVGLLWQPLPELSIYGNYVEGFGGPNVFATGPGNTPLTSQTSQQWEVGFKTALFNNRLNITGAYFDITKQNISTPIFGTRFSRPTGEAQNKGYELDVTGEILPGWNVIGAYSYIDSEITKDPFNAGNRLANVPKHGGSLWTTYALQDPVFHGLKFGAGVLARGARFGTDANDFTLSGYAIVNLMASYEMKVAGSKLTAQLNIDNILDKEYFESGRSERQHWGNARTFLGSLKLEF
jgi:iron complex outermembrane recepter protein